MVICFDIYLLVQVNYSLTTQVLKPYSCDSRQNGQQIISENILQNSTLVENTQHSYKSSQETKYSGLPKKKNGKDLKLHLEQANRSF